MERFTDKHMTESQITEIMELMNGEHAEALKLWAKHNENIGKLNGVVSMFVLPAMLIGAAKVTAYAAAATWYTGKALVGICKDCLSC